MRLFSVYLLSIVLSGAVGAPAPQSQSEMPPIERTSELRKLPNNNGVIAGGVFGSLFALGAGNFLIKKKGWKPWEQVNGVVKKITGGNKKGPPGGGGGGGGGGGSGGSSGSGTSGPARPATVEIHNNVDPGIVQKNAGEAPDNLAAKLSGEGEGGASEALAATAEVAEGGAPGVIQKFGSYLGEEVVPKLTEGLRI
ncbi:MAG: hypothetical protein M1829_006042 [Trizodia sp. TS-e1964]|nr:MAG: hypothetical protein M1829_006042 [Trizodia sp. TS-e1964]